MYWQIGRHRLNLKNESLLMGILNVTPDSFSDGGLHATRAAAVAHAGEILQQGAAFIDIGGESTRPGANEVTEEEEERRVLPVLKDILQTYPHALVSIDTRKPALAGKALELGAHIINDITGFRHPEMVDVCRKSDCGMIVMHMQGEPETMQNAPCYEDVTAEVSAFFLERYQSLMEAGIAPERLCFDPGIGFGKTKEHNITLLHDLRKLHTCGCALMMALSRKRFLSTILGSTEEGRSALSTATATVYAHQKGARIHRVHDVRECAQALRLVQAFDEGK